MAEQERTLGIIGGAGVGAAAALYVDVCARFRAASAALPQVAIWNLPLSDELERSFLGAGADPAAIAQAEALVAQGVDRLAAAGASVIAMPCNALQRVAARESQRAGLPFVDMIAATVEAVGALGHGEAVLLATATTYAAGNYDGLGVQMLEPAPQQRAELAALIARLGGGPQPTAGELLALIEHVARPGAAVVIGCTDICGLIDASAAAAGGPVLESLACLAERCTLALGAPALAGDRG
jgi:aspartate racemase